ncbi:hypothetical protein TRFO_33948 [Tritrichomonas foetus]|uniref:Uncharacterized protein n=1 Tax=Tritrichomonas foetus TaxID=1144522 RepID=A0A1J4JLL7_9EUKA|nr:hypothetical protein TRFO_33948 [Tritrichomonas foetus]|eukprot:OHS99577.1 hypothetical protein TRFO_33948 [Tritrichomonas foetus]
MEQNEESAQKSFVDDPNFSLKFVNKKSSERVLELVDEIKAAFNRPELQIDPTAPESLAKVDDNLELLLHSDQILQYGQDPDPPQMNPPRLASLKPFLFPFYPASAPKNSKPLISLSSNLNGNVINQSNLNNLNTINNNNTNMNNINTNSSNNNGQNSNNNNGNIIDQEFVDSRREFLTEARMEHERLLWSFQDRLVRDLCSADDQFQQSPFQIATVQLAKEQTLPIHLVEKRKVTLQTRFSALMKKSQKKATSVLEAQKRNAKMIQDAKQFQANFARMQKNEAPSLVPEKPYEIPVVCPFSFLCDFSKQ